jgi:hypothetical protein
VTPEDIERICSDFVRDVPIEISRTSVRDIVCEILWQLEVPPQDLPLLMLLILDKYSMSNVLEQARNSR